MQRRTILFIILGIVALIILAVFFLGGGTTDTDSDQPGFFSALFGGGDSSLPTGDTALPTPPEGSPQINTETAKKEGRLNKIIDEPVVGAVLQKKGQKVKYFKQRNGNLFENSFTGGSENRISNVTTLGILSAGWSESKDSVALQYYDNGELKKYYFQYTGTSTNNSGFLPKEILHIAMAPGEERMAYLVPANDTYAVVTALPDNTKQKTVGSVPIPDFLLSWPTTNIISLQTKASALAPGYLYTLNPSNGVLAKVIGDVPGLTALWSPSGKRLLYSESSQEGKVIKLQYLSRETGLTKQVELTTLPEKCVWSKKNDAVVFCAIPQLDATARAQLPDDWWQGNIAFNDALWQINLDTGLKKMLLPTSAFDATNLFVSEDESFLFFTDKKENLLWSLKTQ
ncbi:MAG: hypothetical protein A3C84_01635 [Candidatus Ryanbacteria bacterium RIFCSPHIGHO2_02_FULL_48_12]|uniref:Dipeptidylpeptidase IV N-terminal domain-containing protein n=1 Tax=Candidatus Ryanbacteria bacterium RIFCSPHIGHO2_01_FULL_48_27 TaxID=1802115 RepID=A0A1G2G896_9BACT|nr:MAG: hypothetical protein A2756_06370 [Candidatus Ryanbacteria bacterium RIFCSPHIGHO2_01_FULL_48_27]OGZ49183.1 MAG: hypothetical protein A3C84_01635 [Candidatus Ryanbacteria bacterium RIFCSPHIGHO2_02_FULL_48_12]